MSTHALRTTAPRAPAVAQETTLSEGDRLLLLLADEHDRQAKMGSELYMGCYFRCGSPACSLGWATTVPELRAAGVRGKALVVGFYEAFAISTKQANDLFGGMHTRTHAEQSAILRAFVAARSRATEGR